MVGKRSLEYEELAMTSDRPLSFKIVLIGDSGVGKTSLASVYAQHREHANAFPQTYITTNGM